MSRQNLANNNNYLTKYTFTRLIKIMFVNRTHREQTLSKHDAIDTDKVIAVFVLQANYYVR